MMLPEWFDCKSEYAGACENTVNRLFCRDHCAILHLDWVKEWHASAQD